MSEELSNYLSEMNKVYDSAISGVKKQYSEDSSAGFLKLLLNNNHDVKKYVPHLRLGCGLSNPNDDKIALAELCKRHSNFINFVISF